MNFSIKLLPNGDFVVVYQKWLELEK